MTHQPIDWHDVSERAYWTALQSFVGTLTAVSIVDIDREVLWSAVAAVVSALLSFVKTLAQERLAVLDTRRKH